MLLTVTTKASSMCGPFTSGRQNHYCFSAISQNAQINLVTCKMVSSVNHGWVSVSPDHKFTHKNRATTYLIYYYFCSVDKNEEKNSEMDQPFNSTPSYSFSENEF